ncbi:hypothetical protein DOY81_007640 [Sarcophaga bullata]|nr:hypothetical protein DOY81_007640 [Sarcophaga bullata]
MFVMKESKLNVRYKMQNRVWQKANSLKIDEDKFIEYIIEGIPDVNLRNVAKLRFTTKNEILQTFRNVRYQAKDSELYRKSERKNEQNGYILAAPSIS